MKLRWISLIIAFFLVGGVPIAALGVEAFQISQYVTDRAGILSQNEQVQLSQELYRYAEATGNQILVVLVPSLAGEELVDYTERLFELNKPGVKGKDNGLILLVALEERKVRIEVGYGLEEAVPDGRAGNIIRDEITPRFQRGDYYGGITAGVYSIIKSITPDYNLEGYQAAPVRGREGSSFPSALIVALIIAFFSIISGYRGNQTYHRRYRRGYSEAKYWGGGGFGGSGGGRSGRGGFRGGGGGFGGGGASGGW